MQADRIADLVRPSASGAPARERLARSSTSRHADPLISRNNMDTEDSLLCVSATHADADRLIGALSRCGIDVTKLSLVGHG
jgi:hypothetical protein